MSTFWYYRSTSAVAMLAMALRVAAAAASGAEIDLGPQGSAACRQPDASATTVYAAPADVPPIAAAMRQSGTAYVRIDLDANGTVRETSIVKSSGTPHLDRAALQAAQQSKFQPEVRDCRPVGGEYIFVVDFPAS